jgi:hypothetical protein
MSTFPQQYRDLWQPALVCLTDINKAQLVAADNKIIKAKFAGFNKHIERLFHTQKEYTIPNNALRQVCAFFCLPCFLVCLVVLFD